MLDVALGTIVVHSDIGCPWAHVAVWRLHDARRRIGLEGAVSFDHRGFPLELFLADGTNLQNPGIEPSWEERDDPTIDDDLLRRAAAGG